MTILGEHTLSETNDLVKNYDNLFQGMTKSAAGITITDPTWKADYNMLLKRYTNGKSAIPSPLPLISSNVQTCEVVYQTIVQALENTQGGVGKAISTILYSIPFAASFAPSDEGQTLVGSAQDLFNRLSIMLNAVKAPGVIENTVQPTAPDTDLSTYQWADKTIKSVEKVATSPVTWMLLGGGAAVVGIGMLWTAKKVYL